MIKIPLQLESEANCSEHWTKSSKRHRMQRSVVNSYLKKYLPVIPKLPVCVTLIRYSPRQFDYDNTITAFKYVRDQVSDHVLGYKYSKTGKRLFGRNDSSDKILWQYDIKKTTEKEEYITIEIATIDKDVLDLILNGPSLGELVKRYKQDQSKEQQQQIYS